MISVEQVQTVLDTIRAENRTLKRLVERQKRRKQHQPEYEAKSERPVRSLPELDKLLAGTEEEVDELMAVYRL